MAGHIKRSVGEKSKALSANSAEKLFVGLDVHRRSYSVAIWSDQRGLIAQWTQPAAPDVLLARLEPVTSNIIWIVYEAGPTGYGLVRDLRAAGYRADVIATCKLLKTVSRDSKSDRLDSCQLAQHAGLGLLHTIRVPTEQEERDRQIVRMREGAIRKRRRARQQIKSFLLLHGLAQPDGLSYWTKSSLQSLRTLKLPPELRLCLDVLLDDEAHAHGQVLRLKNEIAKLSRTERHSQHVKVITSVPGVGTVTAMTLQTELIAPKRFAHAGEVAKMVGLAPRVHESGERRREGRLNKAGNWRLRTILVEAAWRWVGRDPTAKARFTRLVRNTGDCKKAIVGVARKLLVILWKMVTSGETYRVTVAV